MTEQQLDFKKIQKMIGKCTPAQLGSLMKQYSERHLARVDKKVDKDYTDVVKFFGDLDGPDLFTQSI